MENDYKPKKRKLSDIEETLEETEQDKVNENKDKSEPSKETLPEPEEPEEPEEEEEEEQTNEQKERDKERQDNQNGILWDSSGRRWGCISASLNTNRMDDLKCDRSASVSTSTNGRIWIEESSGLELMGKLFDVSGSTKLWNKINATGYLYEQFNNSNPNEIPELPFKCCRDCDWLLKELYPCLVEQKEKETKDTTPSLLDMYSYGFCGPKHPHHRMCMQLEILEVLGSHRVFRLLESTTDTTDITKEDKTKQKNPWIAYFEPSTIQLQTGESTFCLTWSEVMEDPRLVNWEDKTKKHVENVTRECKLCSMSHTISQKLSTLSPPLRQRMVYPIGPTGTIIVTPHFRKSDLNALSRSTIMFFSFLFLYIMY